jgi:hypothetical protein
MRLLRSGRQRASLIYDQMRNGVLPHQNPPLPHTGIYAAKTKGLFKMATPVGLKQRCRIKGLRSCTYLNRPIDPVREYLEAPAP